MQSTSTKNPKKRSYEGKTKKVKLIQSGTKQHFDVNPHHLWKKQKKQHPSGDGDFESLDRWRAFQSQVVLTSQLEGDSSLECCPGIHRLAERYYELSEVPSEGLNIFRRGSYSCHLSKLRNSDLLDKFVYVRRIPKNWDVSKLAEFPSKEKISKMTRKEITNFISSLKKELEKDLGDLPQEGDFIIWDGREAHTTGEVNATNQIRQTFYHAFLPALGSVNGSTIKELQRRRESGLHPPDFPKTWADLEQEKYKPMELTKLGKLLYDYSDWKKEKEEIKDVTFHLSETQIQFYKRYGFVVIPNVIEDKITTQMKSEIKTFLKRRGLDLDNLEKTLSSAVWKKVSGLFGGMLELYWLPSMEQIRQHPNPYWITVQLLEKTWATGKEEGFEQPYGPIDSKELWLYVDRSNLRFPTKIVKDLYEKEKKQTK